MTTTSSTLATLVSEVQGLATESTSNALYGVPTLHSAAQAAAVDEIEAVLGRALPPELRELVGITNGWDHLWFGLELSSIDRWQDAELLDQVAEMAESWEVDGIAAELVLGAEDDMRSTLLLNGDNRIIHWTPGCEPEFFTDIGDFLVRVRESHREHIARLSNTAEALASSWTSAARAAADAELAADLEARHLEQRPVKRTASRVKAKPCELPEPRYDGERLVARVALGAVVYLKTAPSPSELSSAVQQCSKMLGRQRVHGTVGLVRVDDLPAPREFMEMLGDPDAYQFNLKGGGRHEEFDITFVSRHDDPTSAAEISVRLPTSTTPESLEALIAEWCEILPIRSGMAGYVVWANPNAERDHDGWDVAFEWCRKFHGLEVLHPNFGRRALREVRGPSWLTLLSQPFVRACEDRLRFRSPVKTREVAGVLIVKAGPKPSLCVDAPERGLSLIAHKLSGVLIRNFEAPDEDMAVARQSTATDLPGFLKHGASNAFLRRYEEPRGYFFDETPLETALAYVEKLLAAGDRSAFEATAPTVFPFQDALLDLYNASVHVADVKSPLVLEALEFAAQYPGYARPAVFNNLMYRYLAHGTPHKGLELMPVAVARCRAAEFAMFFHNAACIYALTGHLEEALDMVQLALELGYGADTLRDDSDLEPLHRDPRWAAALTPKAD